MVDYTPTTEEVRNRYLSEVFPEDEAEFDRWLAQVKAEAWAEGWLIGVTDNQYDGGLQPTVNPYLEETK